MKKALFFLFGLIGSTYCYGAIGNGPGGVAINFIEDEGSTVTQRNTLNFIGGAVTCVDNAGQIRTDCTITSASGGTSNLEVFSNFDATRSSPTASISIGDSLKLSVSGSTATLAVDFSSVTSRSDAILNQSSFQSGAKFSVSSGSVNGQLLIYGGGIRTILLPSTTEAMRLVNISSHQVFIVIQSSGTNWWKIGSDVTNLGVPSFDIYNATTQVKDVSISTNDVISIGGTMAFTPLTASRPLKLDSSKNVTSGLIDLTADVTGILPSANLPANVDYTNVQQTISASKTFTSTQTFSAGVTASSVVVTGLSSGQCVETGTNGLLTVTGSACGSGGGGSASLSGPDTGLLSKNGAIALSSATLTYNTTSNLLTIGATTQFSSVSTTTWTNVSSMTFGNGSALILSTSTNLQLPSGQLLTNSSSVTVQGVITAGNNITLTQTAGVLTVAETTSPTVLAVGTGTAANFTTRITSPTVAISFLGSQFSDTTNGTTNFVALNQSSVTLLGQSPPASSIAAGSLGSSVLASSFPVTGVTAAAYTNTNLTVNAQGLITAASNGSAGGGGVTVYPASSTAFFDAGGFHASTGVFSSSITANALILPQTISTVPSIYASAQPTTGLVVSNAPRGVIVVVNGSDTIELANPLQSNVEIDVSKRLINDYPVQQLISLSGSPDSSVSDVLYPHSLVHLIHTRSTGASNDAFLGLRDEPGEDLKFVIVGTSVTNTGNGPYSSAAFTVNLATASTNYGNVGLGISTATSKLHIVSSGTVPAMSITGQFSSLITTATFSSQISTINWNAGNNQYLTLTGTTTISFSNPLSAGRYLLLLKQDGTGGRTVTWPVNTLWSGGITPALTATASKIDAFSLIYDSIDDKYLGDTSLNH